MQGRNRLLRSLVILSTPVFAQYDKVASLASDSALTPIGGPASSPLGWVGPYAHPDLRPTGILNDQLPKWIQFGLDERFRLEGSDPYMMNRFGFGAIVKPSSWFK